MQVIEFSIRGLKKYDLFWSYGKRHYQCEIIKRQFQKGTEKAKYKSEIRKKAISEGNSESKNTKVRLEKRQFQKGTAKVKIQK